MQFVTEQIAIGNSADGYDEQALIENNITATVNCAIDLGMPQYDLIMAKGGENNGGLICGPGNTIEMIGEIIDHAVNLLEVHSKILIYCHSGLDRSPLVAAGAVSELEKFAFDRAWKQVRESLEDTEYKVTFTSIEVENILVDMFNGWSKQMGTGQYLVDIVMPCVGGDDDKFEKTQNCLRSIKESTNYRPYRIIGINDGTPTDKNLNGLLEKYCDDIIVHEKNQGVAQSRADGNDKAQGDIICQIDNDVVFFPNWLTPLVGSLNKLHDVAIIAPFFTCNMGYFAKDITKMEYKGHFEVGEVGTACMLYYKELVDKIGNFDPKLYNLWEDIDFCRRVTMDFDIRTGTSKPKAKHDMLRHKIVINPSVTVYHSGYVDPETGEWTTDPNNTRSLPLVQNRKKIATSMKIMNERWGVKHGRYDEFVTEKTKS